MNAVGMADVVAFAKKWLEAGSHVVQYWPAWESQASAFFDFKESDPDVLHGVMSVVCCVCFGDGDVVKQGVRDASPRVISICCELLGHLQQFAVVLEAESRFRARELSSDWTLHSSDGKIVVRSEFREPTGETEH